MQTNLVHHKINSSWEALIDPDNVFWSIIKRDEKSDNYLPKIIALYDKVRDRLDNTFRDFRFSANLSAIYIDPTDRCNAACPYCYIPSKVRKNGTQMSREQLSYVLNKIKKYFGKKKAVVVFHASEPLLVKDIIFEAIQRFNGQFNFGLQTNAILLQEKDVEFLKKYRVGVGISLDSFIPSANNRLRPSPKLGGNFDKAVQAIEWFSGYEGLNVITTVTKLNVTHLPGLVEFLHKKKVPCVLLNPLRLTQESSRALKPNRKLLAKYFIKAVNRAIELSLSSPRRIIIGNFTNVILGIVAPVARRLMCDISPCGGGRCFLTITAKGDMIPCGEFIGLKRFRGGNIFSGNIKQAMQSKSFKTIRSRIVEKIPECDICTFRNICGAPCPAELYALGDMYQPSIFCEFYKEIIRYAFKIISQRKEKYCFREDGFKNLKYDYRLGS